MAFQHQAGTAMECLSGIYVTEVHDGSPAAKSGLLMHDKILQVCSCFVTFYIPSAVEAASLIVLFMSLQCNGYDFTMVTHKKAVDYIKKHPVLNLLVARKGVTST
ncbi:hypothetical protein Cfor_04601 [Coptotermes formosanus]|uniref:Uncharacterized protein n=1 Tax=Coptotermes formosanus TaxID=36987 RepID=A0A6L2PIW6_COPFO|nr:hypothetical protein Cfor_04601 [Coptotermes formosanus]